jgi:DUF1009 family protein
MKIGLIAGYGKLPIIIAKRISENNELVFIRIKTKKYKNDHKLCKKYYSIELEEFEKLIKILKKEDVDKVIMSGLIEKRKIFNIKNEKIKEMLNELQDRKNITILKAIEEKFKSYGIEILDPSEYIEDMLAEKGILTKRKPTQEEIEDISFGFPIAKKIAQLDIGQSIAVKNKVVIAVEGIKGTDELIKTATRYVKYPVIIKVGRNNDMKFDPPVVGVNTIKLMGLNNSLCLAIEAKKTIIIEKEKFIEKANSFNISIVGI